MPLLLYHLTSNSGFILIELFFPHLFWGRAGGGGKVLAKQEEKFEIYRKKALKKVYEKKSQLNAIFV